MRVTELAVVVVSPLANGYGQLKTCLRRRAENVEFEGTKGVDELLDDDPTGVAALEEWLPQGKVQLSEACKDEAARARRLSWPARQMGSHHLALLAGPGQVARELRRLIGQPQKEQVDIRTRVSAGSRPGVLIPVLLPLCTRYFGSTVPVDDS
jgi:hypothetical protein